MQNYLRSLSVLQFILLLLVAAASALATLHYTAGADMYRDGSGRCQGSAYGRGCYRGYFNNGYDNNGTSVLPEISGGLAIPNNINSAGELCSLLRSAYNSGNAQKRTGAAFIYSTIYGLSAPGEGRGVSDTRWDNFCARLQEYDDAGRIDWRGNVSSHVNSYYQGSGTNDDAFYYNPKNESGIRISFPGGYDYKILRRCANPIGNRCTSGCFTGLWELQPKISGTSNSKVSIDATSPDRTAYVDKDGGGSSSDVRWIFSRIVVPGNRNVPGAGDSDDAPSQRYDASSSQVSYRELGDGTRRFSQNITNLRTDGGYFIETIPGIDVGKKVCWILGVRPPKASLNKWRYAEPKCITIVPRPIRPQVQVLGYDARLSGAVKTSLSRQLNTSTYYGSWAEYGIFSSGVNDKFASSAGLKAGGSMNQSDWSSLTFANKQSTQTPRSSCYSGGGFGCATHPNRGVTYPQTFINNMRSRCPTPISNSNITVPALLNTASTQFFCTNGTATISQNITYSDASTAAAQSLPQVVIIANDIVIDSSVTRVDAWLLAGRATGVSSTGRISTCSGMFTGGGASINRFPAYSAISQTAFYARKNECDKPLVVNGPVASKQLFLYRTTSPQDAGKNLDQNLPPAERFNLRADAFLWAFNGGTSTPTDPVAQTVSIKELPPRF